MPVVPRSYLTDAPSDNSTARLSAVNRTVAPAAPWHQSALDSTRKRGRTGVQFGMLSSRAGISRREGGGLVHVICVLDGVFRQRGHSMTAVAGLMSVKTCSEETAVACEQCYILLV